MAKKAISAVPPAVHSRSSAIKVRLLELAAKVREVPGCFKEEEEQPDVFWDGRVEHWHKIALPYIETKPFLESWLDFLAAWQSAKYPMGATVVTTAWETAEAADPPEICRDWDSEPLIRLVKLCRELQRLQGDQPFYVTCRQAGELLGVSHNQAWQWLRGLCRLGVLTMTKPGNRKRANRYRYLGD